MERASETPETYAAVGDASSDGPTRGGDRGGERARQGSARPGVAAPTATRPDREGVAVDLRAPAWHAHAMCRGKTEIFFAAPGERDGRRNRREALARAYCACCTVADECRAAGREGREHGMWGGENDEQRAAAGFGARSPHRRAVAAAARKARARAEADDSDGDADADVA